MASVAQRSVAMITVGVRATTEAFQKGLDAARKGLDKFAMRVERFGRMMGGPVETQMAKFGKSLRRIGKSGGAAAIGIGLIAAAVWALKKAYDAVAGSLKKFNEMLVQQQAFGIDAQAQTQAEEIAKATGRSAEEAVQYGNAMAQAFRTVRAMGPEAAGFAERRRFGVSEAREGESMAAYLNRIGSEVQSLVAREGRGRAAALLQQGLLGFGDASLLPLILGESRRQLSDIRNMQAIVTDQQRQGAMRAAERAIDLETGAERLRMRALGTGANAILGDKNKRRQETVRADQQRQSAGMQQSQAGLHTMGSGLVGIGAF